jgi:hypothetical protein
MCYHYLKVERTSGITCGQRVRLATQARRHDLTPHERVDDSIHVNNRRHDDEPRQTSVPE